MASIAVLHNASDANARNWANMLVAPQDHLVRAPSNTPFLASKTRFVRTLDVPYAQTDAGKFSVAMLPDAMHSFASTGLPGNTPPALTGLVLTSYGELVQAGVNSTSYLDSGFIKISDGAGADLGTTNFQDLGAFDVLLAGIWGIRITQNTSAVSNMTLSATTPPARRFYCKIGTVDSGTKIITWSSNLALLSGTASWTITLGAQAMAVVVQITTATGAANPDPSGFRGLFDMSCTSALVPASSGAQSFGLVKSDLAQAGQVGLQRCTAMSLLVTNMASPLQSGGELVSARTRQSILGTPGGTAGLMNAMKQLPEQLYWRSGNIADGGYTWWLPDDLTSYEPLPIGERPPSENILLACGAMADVGGFVRIIATWTFEFYTPVQLFARDYNVCYGDAHKDLWQGLARKPACSANAGHLALLASVATLASQVYDFYSKHQKTIDPMVGQAVSLGKRLVQRKKATDQNAQSSRKPNVVGAAPKTKPNQKGGLRVKATTGRKLS